MDGMNYVAILVIAAFLGLIPASIASKKGYSFGLWWFYGFALFIVAIIHSAILPDNTNQSAQVDANHKADANPTSIVYSAADELKKYKELLDIGAITEEEYTKKKEELLHHI